MARPRLPMRNSPGSMRRKGIGPPPAGSSSTRSASVSARSQPGVVCDVDVIVRPPQEPAACRRPLRLPSATGGSASRLPFRRLLEPALWLGRARSARRLYLPDRGTDRHGSQGSSRGSTAPTCGGRRSGTTWRCRPRSRPGPRGRPSSRRLRGARPSRHPIVSDRHSRSTRPSTTPRRPHGRRTVPTDWVPATSPGACCPRPTPPRTTLRTEERPLHHRSSTRCAFPHDRRTPSELPPGASPEVSILPGA